MTLWALGWGALGLGFSLGFCLGWALRALRVRSVSKLWSGVLYASLHTRDPGGDVPESSGSRYARIGDGIGRELPNPPPRNPPPPPRSPRNRKDCRELDRGPDGPGSPPKALPAPDEEP